MGNQSYQRPPIYSGKRFWHIWMPFLINWGIGSVASILAATVFMAGYMRAHMKEVLAAYGNQDAMTEVVNRVLEVMQRYTTEIQGATALATIPVMAFLYYRDRERQKAQGVPANKKAPAREYIYAILIAALMNVAMNNLILIGGLSDYSAGYEKTAEAFYSAPLGMQILCLGILTPAAEELVFRGLMYRRMREDTGVVMSVIYSALVFGLFHGNVVQMAFGTVMGLMLAYVCEKYGSVAAPIAAHITVNLVSVLGTHFRVFDRLLSDILVAGSVTVACATAASCVFLMIWRIDEKPEAA